MSDLTRRTRENLAFNIRYVEGVLLETEQLQWVIDPAGINAGKPVVASYMGDLQLRFVFRSPGLPDSRVRPPDLKNLDLTVERAVAIACQNFKRSNPTPIAMAFTEGVYVLRGVDANMVAHYLMDHGFWRKQLARFPHGVVVAVPKRGGLYFADASNQSAVEELTRLATKALHTAGQDALSHALYRFGEKGWQVHTRLPEPPKPEAPAAAVVQEREYEREEQDANEDDAERLDLAASGQKMVIMSIVANFLLRGLDRVPGVSTWLVVLLSLMVAMFALVGAVRMCTGLRRLQGEKILFMVLCFVPFINIVALIYLSMKTTKMLRVAGWTVGFLGATR
jgi:hypothetical protein